MKYKAKLLVFPEKIKMFATDVLPKHKDFWADSIDEALLRCYCHNLRKYNFKLDFYKEQLNGPEYEGMNNHIMKKEHYENMINIVERLFAKFELKEKHPEYFI